MTMDKSEAEWREKGKKQSDELWDRIKFEREKKGQNKLCNLKYTSKEYRINGK